MNKNIVAICLAALASPCWAADQFLSQLGAIQGQLKPALSAVAAAEASWGSEQDRLLEMSRSHDASNRQTAVRGMRYVWHDEAIRGRVLEMLRDAKENIEVRRECLKTLTSQFNDGRAVEAIQFWAFREDSSPTLTALARKALHTAAVADSDARRELLGAARGGSVELRRAAIWGLFEASQNDSVVRDFLLETAGSRREKADVRIEALKSLYLAMDTWKTKDMVLDWAKNKEEDLSLRYGAILALSRQKEDWGVKAALEDLSKDDQLRQIRHAAALSLADPGNPEIISYFHLGYRRGGPYGTYVDPIDVQ